MIKRFFCKYYPLKRLDYSQNQFQSIYKLDKVQRIQMIDFVKCYSPFGLYGFTYLTLFDINNKMHMMNCLILFFVGVNMNYMVKRQNDKQILKLEINKNSDQLLIHCSQSAISKKQLEIMEKDETFKITRDTHLILHLQKSHIKEISFLFYNPKQIENDQHVLIDPIQLEKDFLNIILKINGMETDLYVKIFANQIKEYNEYLVALGLNKEIIQK